MNCGGVEKAVIELIKKIPRDQFTVDLLLLEKKGEFLKNIPNWVNVIQININELEKYLVEELSIRDTVKYSIKRRRCFEALNLLTRYIIAKLKRSPAPAYEAVLGKRKLYEYDIALDFHGYCSLTTYLIAENVVAKSKYTWIHSENIARNIFTYEKYLRHYKAIYCVSNKCREIALSTLPCEYRNRIHVFYNFCDREEIVRLAQVGDTLKHCADEVILLTAGRLSPQKGYDIALRTAAQLKDNGLNFKWYFCGDGEEREKIENQIKELDLNQQICMLGFQNNPYGYMNTCDIYVQCSRYEGYAVTLVEASSLHCPIVTTDVSGAREEISDGVNGFIVNCEVSELVNAIQMLISNEGLRRKIRESKTSVSFSEAKSFEILHRILEDA